MSLTIGLTGGAGDAVVDSFPRGLSNTVTIGPGSGGGAGVSIAEFTEPHEGDGLELAHGRRPSALGETLNA